MLLCAAPLASAEPRQVEVAVEPGSELFARLVGQTADLALELVAVGNAWQRPGALRVWLEGAPGEAGREVVVADPVTGRTLRRTVAEGAQGGLAASAHAEAIALVVRSGLLELLAPPPEPSAQARPTTAHPERTHDDSPGRARARDAPETRAVPANGEEDATVGPSDEGESERETESAAEEREPPVVAEPTASQSETDDSAPGTLALTLRGAIQVAFDGSVPPPALAPEIGIGLRARALGAALVAGHGFVHESRDATSVVELARHHAALEVSWTFGETTDTGLELAARGGLYALVRRTQIRDTAFLATPDTTTLSPLFSARARLRVPLAGGPTTHHRLLVAIEGGVDLVPGAPTLGYERDGRFVTRDALWIVEPILALALEYAFYP